MPLGHERPHLVIGSIKFVKLEFLVLKTNSLFNLALCNDISIIGPRWEGMTPPTPF